jgi:hyperosmotically inducible protein
MPPRRNEGGTHMKPGLKTVLAAALAGLVLAGTGCASTPERSSAGEYLDDSVITMKVKAAIIADEELKATEINVETFKGQVQLSGFVRDPAHISRAIRRPQPAARRQVRCTGRPAST